MKISGVYQIVNTVTGDRYVGSSKNVIRRWGDHKRSSRWEQHTNSPLYNDFQKYGLDKFRFQILAPVEPEYLTQVEQEFIEMLHPTYNSKNAKGRNVESLKEYQKEYHQSDKVKEAKRKYQHQLCLYKGEELTVGALRKRFYRAGVEHPWAEAKKYLIEGTDDV